MRKNIPQTPLLALLRALDDAQRIQLATDAGTTVGYLYSLASCQRSTCRAKLASAIEDASRKMHEETLGLTPVVTMRQLAIMCAPTAEPDGA